MKRRIKDKEKANKIAELKDLTKIAKAKEIGLKSSGTKVEIAERIYERENSTENRKIDEMFKKIPNPNKNNSENLSIHHE